MSWKVPTTVAGDTRTVRIPVADGASAAVLAEATGPRR